MKLRYRTKAKPVTISLNLCGVECSDLESLRKNFRGSDILQLMGKNDNRMRVWLERNGRPELAERFEKVVKKYAEYDLPSLDYLQNLSVFGAIYLDLLKIFFADEFVDDSVNSLFDVLMIWSKLYDSRNTTLVCLLNYLNKNPESFKSFYKEHPTKLTANYFFNCCIFNKVYEDCISLYWENLTNHPDWIDCGRVFDVASYLYWTYRKPEHLFLVAKLLIENFPTGEGLQTGVSCLIKAVEQNNEDAIKYFGEEGPQKDLICQSFEGCKAYYEKYPSKDSYDKYFDFCVRKTRESWSFEYYRICCNMQEAHHDWADDENDKKLFDISSDFFWVTYNPVVLTIVASFLIEKWPNEENVEFGFECLSYAANQLDSDFARSYMKQLKTKENINFEKNDNESSNKKK